MSRLPLIIVLGMIACRHADPATEDIVPATLIAGQPPIPYPPDLFSRRVEGDVMLYLFVDSTGAVLRDSTRVSHSSGHAEFDAAALEAAPTLRFNPARRGAVAVAAPIQVPIRFRLPLPGQPKDSE